MPKGIESNGDILNLEAGQWVEVRSREEILAALDERGRLENLAFVGKMLQYCGKQSRVYKRADKTRDNIEPWSIRRMTNSVHLEGVWCDGEGHGGCGVDYRNANFCYALGNGCRWVS